MTAHADANYDEVTDLARSVVGPDLWVIGEVVEALRVVFHMALLQFLTRCERPEEPSIFKRPVNIASRFLSLSLAPNILDGHVAHHIHVAIDVQVTSDRR